MRLTIALFVLLAGCETMQEKQARESVEQQVRAEEYRRGVIAQCRGYGVPEGTEEFRRCLMQVDMAYRQQNDAQRQMMLQQYIQQQGVFRR